jgi:GNAT superfamily N-acetyltransferase
MQIKVKEEDSEILEIIKNGVIEYNSKYLGKREFKPFVIYAEENSQIIGGIVGEVVGNCLRIDWLFVEEAFRGKKIGTRLFNELDKFAKANNCSIMQAETFDFQAKPFYEKQGFTCVGIIEKWVGGRDCHFMRKEL